MEISFIRRIISFELTYQTNFTVYNNVVVSRKSPKTDTIQDLWAFAMEIFTKIFGVLAFALSAKSSPPLKLPSNEYNIFLPWVQKRGGEKRDQTKPANTFIKVGYIQQTKICVCSRQMLYVSGVRRIQNWVFLFLEARRENCANRHPSPRKSVEIQ